MSSSQPLFVTSVVIDPDVYSRALSHMRLMKSGIPFLEAASAVERTATTVEPAAAIRGKNAPWNERDPKCI